MYLERVKEREKDLQASMTQESEVETKKHQLTN